MSVSSSCPLYLFVILQLPGNISHTYYNEVNKEKDASNHIDPAYSTTTASKYVCIYIISTSPSPPRTLPSVHCNVVPVLCGFNGNNAKLRCYDLMKGPIVATDIFITIQNDYIPCKNEPGFLYSNASRL